MTGKFLRGFVDGSLSTLGIVINTSSATSAIIIAAALGGTLANGISNLLSAYTAEGVKQYKKLRGIEQAVVVAMVAFVGIYLGKLSGRNIVLSGLKMAALCIALPSLVYLVQLFIVPSQN